MQLGCCCMLYLWESRLVALWRLADKAEVGKVESLEGELTGGIFQCLSMFIAPLPQVAN